MFGSAQGNKNARLHLEEATGGGNGPPACVSARRPGRIVQRCGRYTRDDKPGEKSSSLIGSPRLAMHEPRVVDDEAGFDVMGVHGSSG